MPQFRFVVLLCFAISSTAIAQSPLAVQSHERSEQSVSAGTFLWMTLRSPVDGPTQGTTKSNGFAASYHQQFRPLVGYKTNFSWTKNSEVYRAITPRFSNGVVYQVDTRLDIPVNVFELSSTYVVQQAQNKSNWRAFGELGPGVLMFIPTQAPFSGYSSYRAAAVYGAGATYQMGKRWGIQAEYRGYFYKSPDFAAAPYGMTRGKYWTFTHGPALSVTYRFR